VRASRSTTVLRPASHSLIPGGRPDSAARSARATWPLARPVSNPAAAGVTRFVHLIRRRLPDELGRPNHGSAAGPPLHPELGAARPTRDARRDRRRIDRRAVCLRARRAATCAAAGSAGAAHRRALAPPPRGGSAGSQHAHGPGDQLPRRRVRRPHGPGGGRRDHRPRGVRDRLWRRSLRRSRQVPGDLRVPEPDRRARRHGRRERADVRRRHRDHERPADGGTPDRPNAAAHPGDRRSTVRRAPPDVRAAVGDDRNHPGRTEHGPARPRRAAFAPGPRRRGRARRKPVVPRVPGGAGRGDRGARSRRRCPVRRARRPGDARRACRARGLRRRHRRRRRAAARQSPAVRRWSVRVHRAPRRLGLCPRESRDPDQRRPHARWHRDRIRVVAAELNLVRPAWRLARLHRHLAMAVGDRNGRPPLAPGSSRHRRARRGPRRPCRVRDRATLAGSGPGGAAGRAQPRDGVRRRVRRSGVDGRRGEPRASGAWHLRRARSVGAVSGQAEIDRLADAIAEVLR